MSACDAECELIGELKNEKREIAAVRVGEGHGGHSGSLASDDGKAVQLVEHCNSDTQTTNKQSEKEKEAPREAQKGGIKPPARPTICWTLSRQAILNALEKDGMNGACYSPCFSTIVGVPVSASNSKEGKEAARPAEKASGTTLGSPSCTADAGVDMLDSDATKMDPCSDSGSELKSDEDSEDSKSTLNSTNSDSNKPDSTKASFMNSSNSDPVSESRNSNPNSPSQTSESHNPSAPSTNSTNPTPDSKETISDPSKSSYKLGWQLLLRHRPTDLFTAPTESIDHLALFVRATFVPGSEESCPCCFNRTAVFDFKLGCKQVPKTAVAGDSSPSPKPTAKQPSKQPSKPPSRSVTTQPSVASTPEFTSGTFAASPTPTSHRPIPLLSFTLPIRPTLSNPPLSHNKVRVKKHLANKHLKFAAQSESWGSSIPLSWTRILSIMDHVAGTEEAVLEVTLTIRDVRLKDVRKKRHDDGKCDAEKGGCLEKR